MPANGRWDLIRRLKVKLASVLPGTNLPLVPSWGKHGVHHWQTEISCGCYGARTSSSLEDCRSETNNYGGPLSTLHEASVLLTKHHSGGPIKKNEMDGACDTGEKKGVCRVLLGRREGRRPPGRPRCRWKDINMDLQF